MNAWMTWSWNMWYVTIALCSNFFLDRQLVRSDRRSRCNSPWAQCTTNCHSIFVYDILLVFACTCSGHKGLTGVSLHPYWLIKAPSQAAWTFGRRNHSLIPILLRHRFHKGKCLCGSQCPKITKTTLWPWAHFGEHEVQLAKVESLIIHGSSFRFRPWAPSISKCVFSIWCLVEFIAI